MLQMRRKDNRWLVRKYIETIILDIFEYTNLEWASKTELQHEQLRFNSVPEQQSKP